jgi:hypothetical protein
LVLAHLIFSYAITHILRVSSILLTLPQRKGRGEERVAKLQDSPDCPEREATYVITNGFVLHTPKCLSLLYFFFIEAYTKCGKYCKAESMIPKLLNKKKGMDENNSGGIRNGKQTYMY